jgi:hypothetical protein
VHPGTFKQKAQRALQGVWDALWRKVFGTP